MPPDGVRVLLISGSLRKNSTNTAVLGTAAHFAPSGVVAELYHGLGQLPQFNPDDDRAPLDSAVSDLRHRIHDADALLVSTPEYAGALPGSFKNLLDWTIGDDQPRSIYEKPIAWINASPREARHAHDSLRLVLEYAHASIVEEACDHIPVTGPEVGPDGLLVDPTLRAAVVDSLARLADAVTTSNKSRQAGLPDSA